LLFFYFSIKAAYYRSFISPSIPHVAMGYHSRSLASDAILAVLIGEKTLLTDVEKPQLSPLLTGEGVRWQSNKLSLFRLYIRGYRKKSATEPSHAPSV
jgi:hypothetical protein